MTYLNQTTKCVTKEICLYVILACSIASLVLLFVVL